LGRRGIRNPRVIGCVLAIRAHATYFQNSEIAPRTRSTLQVTRNRSKDGQAQDRNRGLDYSLSLERGNPVLSRWLLQVGAQLIPQGERHQSNEQCDRQQCDYRVVEMTDDGDAIWDRIDWS